MVRFKLAIILGVLFFGLGGLRAEEEKLYTMVNTESYQAQVLDLKEPLIVFFYAEWCPYSGSLLPIYSDIEKEYNKTIRFCRFQLGAEYMDFSSDQGKERWGALKEKYGIQTIPTLVMYNNGKELDRMTGRPEKDIVENYRFLLKQWIDTNLTNPQERPYSFESTVLLHQKGNE